MVTALAINFMFTGRPVRVFNKITLFLMGINFTGLSGGPKLCVLESEFNKRLYTQNPTVQIFFNDCAHMDHIYLHKING